MAEGYQGKDFLLQLGATAGTGTTPYATVAGMRSTSLSLNNEMIDVTNKDNVPWRTLIEGGVQSMSVSLAGVFKDHATLQDMMTIAFAGGIRNFKLISGEGDSFTGAFKLSKLERAGEYNKEETYSISLESSGAITFTEG